MKIIKIKAAVSANNSIKKAWYKTPFTHSLLAGLVLSSASIITQADHEAPAFTLKVDSVNLATNGKQIASTATQSTRVQNASTAYSTNRSVRLRDGGVIWVSKDPTSLNPALDILAPATVGLESGQFSSPLNFTIGTNYPSFINSWEIDVFHAEDKLQKNAIKTLVGRSLKSALTVAWNGVTKSGKQLRVGDKLTYVLTVRDGKGHMDRTHPREIKLTGPLRKRLPSQKIVNNAQNNLALQTIPVSGSRVRVSGRDIPSNHSITIDGERITLAGRKFVEERILRTGRHTFDIAITDANKETYRKPLNVNLDGKYMFMVGLADITAGKSNVSGNMEALGDDDNGLADDVLVEGRLAFYLKGKIRGRYLITAQMDTGTDEIENLFDGIHKKDPQSLFRRIDPDKYYPVYGDNSTIVDDTNSQGKMYARVDWDKSRATWGNFNTDLTGTELSSFNRSLYGAKINHRSTRVTSDGDHRTDFTVFGSETQSAFRHNEFLGTGGSLYYLKDIDIVDGSEKIWVEVRESEGGRVVAKVVMEEGRDYQIDDYQGRIILNRPLLQIAQKSHPSLIKDSPLDGDQVYLMVDYEYVPSDFDSNKASYGARGKVWLSDLIGLGATYVHENRNNEDYDLKGVDITLKKSKGTYLKAEYAESESNQTQGSFSSQDGGLNFATFNDSNPDNSDIKGTAISIEAKVSGVRSSLDAWFKQQDAGFSTASVDNGYNKTQLGAEAIVKLGRVDLSGRVAQVEKEGLVEETSASVQAGVKIGRRATLSGELRHINEVDLSANAGTAASIDGEGTIAALKAGFDFGSTNVYGIAQNTIERKGAYESNDLLTLGAKVAVTNKLDVKAELSKGDRGEGLTVGADYRVGNDYSVYTNVTASGDRIDNNKRALTMGQRKALGDKLKVFSEHQFTRENTESGVANSFGLEYQLNKTLLAIATAQKAQLDKHDGGVTDRDAYSLGLRYRKGGSDASARVEYRRDIGANEETEQFVTTNRANLRLSPSVRLQGKFNHSKTNDLLGDENDAHFTEAAIGVAVRPVNHDRLNVIGKVTYTDDLQPLSQSTNPDEKALIASLESSYQLSQRWEIGGKLAHKESEIRADRNAGSWSRNDASLAAVRARYHMTRNWDASAEYRWMNSAESEDVQHGASISVDRHIGNNMKVGIGYNFTDFDDDLGNNDGTVKGWFLNLIGKF